MTPDLIAIIVASAALAGLILRQGARHDKRSDDLKREVSEQFAKVDERFDKVDERFRSLENRMTQIEKQQAKLEGLLEGLREALTYNRAA